MKVITIIGTRPEIIRTSRIVPKLDKHCDHVIVHTNQNFTTNLKDVFYDQLGLRQPDYVLQSVADTGLTHTNYGLANQLSVMFPQIAEILEKEQPDKVFILGDTNSALCAIIAERMGIPVYHMEAANRSFNRAIPEEVNRVLLDSICSYNLFYTPTNRHTLLSEGHSPKRIFQCGNPTREVLTWYDQQIEKSDILERLGLAPYEGGAMASYFLADIHRAENINNEWKLKQILHGLNRIACRYNYQVIVSMHPSTKDKLPPILILRDEGQVNYEDMLGDHFEYFGLDSKVKFMEPCGFFDFVKLEKHAKVGLTDSGLCSEEYCLLGVPCVIIRNETERPEVVEAGGAMIAGTNADDILEAVQIMEGRSGWTIPDGYGDLCVSDRVVNYILGRAQ